MKITSKVLGEMAANRRAAAAAAKSWGVYGVTKSGALYKKPSVLCDSEAEATAKAAYLESINPGHKYAAKAL